MTRLGTVFARRVVGPLVCLGVVLLLSPALSTQAQDATLRIQAQEFVTNYQEARAAFEANPSEATQAALDRATEAFAAFREANREALNALPPGSLQLAPAPQKRTEPVQRAPIPRPLPLNQLYLETFDSSLGSMTPFFQPDDVPDWHFSDSCPANGLPGHTAPGAARWGDPADCFSYDAVAADTDQIITPVIPVGTCNGQVGLFFNYYLDFQEDQPFDNANVYVSTGASGFFLVADNENGTFGNLNDGGWFDLFVPVNATSTIQASFEGSVSDGSFNTGQGFFVDDIQFDCLVDADLALEKTVDNDEPQPGDEVTFTLTITNFGLGSVVGVEVIDELPDGVTFVGATFSDPDDTYNAGDGIWDVGSLSYLETATINITVQVNTDEPVTNTAFIAFSSLPDPDDSNDSDSAILNPISADLAITKSTTEFSEDKCDQAENPDCEDFVIASFQVKVTNNGPDGVTDVEVTDTLPEDFDATVIVASDGDITYDPVAGTIVWDGFDLGVGDMATLDVTIEGFTNGAVVNTASVTAAGLADTNDRNNTASAFAGSREDPRFNRGRGPGLLVDRTGRRFQSDLSLTKTVSSESATVGDELTYTVTVTNEGPNTNNGIEVTDDIPDCLDILSVTASEGTEFNEPTWDIGQLRVDATATLTVVAEVTASCPDEIVNTAEISSANLADPDSFPQDPFDPQEDDDTASATTAISQIAARTVTLGENFPNPFNPTTVIPVEIGTAQNVRLVVYDLLGRSVQTLVDGELSAGRHEFTFQAGHLATGVYLVRLEAAGVVQTQRITLMK